MFESVTKRYPDGTVAVNDLSLEMPANAITVLVGPSGCGKTTSLRMINRMIDPTAGRILIDGVDVKDRPAAELRRSIGYVIQHAGLFPHRTVVDNIATVPRLLGWDRRRARDRAMELLERVGLETTMAKRYPHQLSGGQQQRVGVARALAADPPVMLMDEPFSAVDPIVRKDLQDEFLRIQADLGKTIVFVTHDIDEAIKLGDKIAVMRVGGHLAQYATPAELLSSPTDGFVEDFLGRDRGVRRLSFFTSDGLELTMAPVLTKDAPQGGESDAPYRLVTDDAGRPVGWRAADAAASDADAADGGLISYGHAFRVGDDSLRAALDSAVLSPTGWAVGVDGDGHVVGVASQETIASAIRAAYGVTRAERAEATP